MKYFFYAVSLLLLPFSYIHADEIAVTMHSLNNDGIDKAIGVIVVKETAQGLRFQPHLRNLEPGTYTFTVNENVGCGSQYTNTGTNIRGMAAGKSINQLPVINVDAQGIADQAVDMNRLTLRDVRGRTLVLSASANMSTNVAQGSEQRVACGSLELHR